MAEQRTHPPVEAIRILPGSGIEIIDQTLLPAAERYLLIDDVADLCEAIRTLRIRGAPLLGIAGAGGVAIAATREPSMAAIERAAATICATRPTAVDLGAGVDRALQRARSTDESERAAVLWELAAAMLRDQLAADRAIGAYGAGLPGVERAVLTHCNTGALATGGLGTALAVVITAWEQGRIERCYATETRPLLQGARLTAWELKELGIPVTLLPDTAAASLIASGAVGAVVTGADRIAANGDTANKVGTYGLAAVAARHGVPFYIAAPTTTIDPGCAGGGGIPIEFRAAEEVGGFAGQRWAPRGIDAYNPAFDVTPAGLIAAIVTERGVVRPPFAEGLAAVCSGS